MNYHFLPENAVYQFIDSSTVFVELARARQQAQTWADSMYWKQQDAYSYLVKTGPDKPADGDNLYITLSTGKKYQVALKSRKGQSGYIVGVKFSDASGSMDSSLIKHPPNPFGLARAVAIRVAQMLKPDLDQVAIMGFYLLTEDLDARRPGGGKLKTRVYGNQSLLMHKELKHKLQYLTKFEVVGGVGWAMSVAPHTDYEPFDVLKNELAKQIRMTIC